MRRRVTVAALLLAVAAPATDAQAVRRGETGLTPSAPLRDVVLGPSGGGFAAFRARAAQWGGRIQASNGEVVTIYFSNSYVEDPAVARSWADFLTSLLHGPELSTVTIALAPLTEVQEYCGREALACYSPDAQAIIAPATDPQPGTTARGVLIHEYGHHVASTRLNTPFGAGDYGTKRWSSYVNVCARAHRGEVFPGAEDAEHYMLNPGEGFAEAYRILNQQRLGLPQEAWEIVSQTFFPDATALALLEQDVTQPWTANKTTTVRALLTAKRRTRALTFATLFDGALLVTPRQSGRARVTLQLRSARGTTATRTFATRAATRITTTVCGERRITARLALAGRVAKTARTIVSVTVSKP